jgi:hypothetical protein
VARTRQGEIDIAQVSKNVTYDMYIERDKDDYGLSDRGGDSDDIDGDSGRDGGRKGDSDGVLGSHDVLCCVLERADLIALVCLRQLWNLNETCITETAVQLAFRAQN